jgi:hypothetical protein
LRIAESYFVWGQLVILTRDDAYLRDGVFDPDRMMALQGHHPFSGLLGAECLLGQRTTRAGKTP